MGIIDAHIHTWRLDDGKRIWIRDKIAALQRDFAIEDFEEAMAGQELDAAIVVQAAADTAETDVLLVQYAEDSRVAGVIGWLDLAAEDISVLADTYARKPKFKGIRAHSPKEFDAAWLSSAPVQRGLEVMAQQHTPVDFLVNCTQLQEFVQAVAPVSGLSAVLDHGGRPFVMTGDTRNWAADIRDVARNTDCYCKLSGLAERAGVEWNRQTLLPWVAILLENFGPERLIFATNWPIMTLMASPALWFDTLNDIFDELGVSDTDRKKIYRDNAAAVYGID